MQIDTAVAGGLLRIAARLLVQSREPAVRCNQAGQHRQGCLECQGSAFAMAEARQSYSQIEVAERKEMLQADGEECLLGGLLVAPLRK